MSTWTQGLFTCTMRLLNIFLLVWISFPIVAQKEDYQWPLGIYIKKCNTCFYRFYYNFKTDPPSVRLRSDSVNNAGFSSAYCDRTGEVVFFTDGFRIYNNRSKMIAGGFGLNPTCPEIQHFLSYPFFYFFFFLGHPTDTNTVFYLHLDYDMYPDSSFLSVGKYLRLTTIRRGHNGMPDHVINKNEILVAGFLQKPAAVRHANGRDWWILVSDVDEGKHYRFLLTSNGFSQAMVQETGHKPPVVGIGTDWNSLGKFSSDGRYYADVHPFNGLTLYNFDRCSGLLSYKSDINFFLNTPKEKFIGGGGVDFSYDGHYLYLTGSSQVTFHPAYNPILYGTVLQYDLEDEQIAFSADTLTSRRQEIKGFNDLKELIRAIKPQTFLWFFVPLF